MENPERLSPQQLEALILEIGAGKYELKTEESTYVKVSEDQMEAWIYLADPGEGKEYTKEDLYELLRENNVISGINSSNIAGIAKKKVYEREIHIASGKKEVQGQNGYYDYFFDPKNYNAAPKIKEDGSVDYFSMNEIQNVRIGEKLAIYHQAVRGEDGFDVTGKVLRCEMVKDLPPLRGRGITNEEDRNVYLARIDGKVELKDNNIDIQPTHEIKGDVDMIIGKVEFFGDVLISGNVSAGVTIRAGRNVVIDGLAEAVMIYAGGDVIFKRGITGAKKAKVSAKGSVMADFIENAEIEAGGEIKANTILNSHISSKASVEVTGKKGIIVGGYVHGLTGVKATNIGNEAEIRTVVHAGYGSSSYDRLVFLTRQEMDMKRELGEMVDEMSIILKNKRTKGALTYQEEEKLTYYNKKKDEIFNTLDTIRQERERLGVEISKGKNARIHVEGNINRGVIIQVENAQMLIDRSTVSMEYSCLTGQIEGNVIVY